MCQNSTRHMGSQRLISPISLGMFVPGRVLVVRTGSACPAITLANTDLRHHNVRNCIQDQYSLCRYNSRQFRVANTSSQLTMAYVTGGYDFNHFMKHILHSAFARVIVNHGHWLISFYWHISSREHHDQPSFNVLITTMLVKISAYEHILRTGGSSVKQISHPFPLLPYERDNFIDELRISVPAYLFGNIHLHLPNPYINSSHMTTRFVFIMSVPLGLWDIGRVKLN